jgi:hypothetical protein
MLDSLSSDASGFAEAWPTYEADKAACVENAPDPAPVRAAIIDGTHPRSEFPTSPASPGWPERSTESCNVSTTPAITPAPDVLQEK